jgi:hypothetical protein
VQKGQNVVGDFADGGAPGQPLHIGDEVAVVVERGVQEGFPAEVDHLESGELSGEFVDLGLGFPERFLGSRQCQRTYFFHVGPHLINPHVQFPELPGQVRVDVVLDLDELDLKRLRAVESSAHEATRGETNADFEIGSSGTHNHRHRLSQ